MGTGERKTLHAAALTGFALALAPAAALAQQPAPAAPSAITARPAPPPPPALALPPSPQPRSQPASRIISLSEVQRAALEQPQLLVARANTSIAKAQVEQTFAPFLPQLAAQASYTRETGNYAPHPGAIPSTASISLPPTNLSPDASFDYWNFGVTANQLIYDFGQTLGRYDAAKKTVEAQRASEETARVQVLLNVRRAYFTARANKDLVDVAHETLDDQNRHLVQVQGFVAVGTQPPIALAQQKAAVANAQVQLITAQNGYETAKAQLNQAAGLTGGTDYDVTDEASGPVEGEDQPRDQLIAVAMAARPEIAALVKQRAAQEATISAAKGAYGPSLSATAGFNEVGTSLSGLVPNWNAGVVATWQFYQGGLTIGQVHAAEAGLESVDAQRSLEELQVRADVDSALLAVRAAKATIGAAEDAVTSAHDQLRLAEQRYATGVGSIIELNDAQVAYSSAAAQLVQARYQLASARAQLLAALGRT
jgi:outer membrane protein